MKAFFISDNIDTFVGLKIAGIKGEVVHNEEAAIKALDTIKDDNEIGIVIFTEKAAALIPNQIKAMKISKQGPLVVEIPDRHGTVRGNDSILRYVKEAIGLKI